MTEPLYPIGYVGPFAYCCYSVVKDRRDVAKTPLVTSAEERISTKILPRCQYLLRSSQRFCRHSLRHAKAATNYTLYTPLSIALSTTLKNNYDRITGKE